MSAVRVAEIVIPVPGFWMTPTTELGYDAHPVSPRALRPTVTEEPGP